MIYHNNQLLIGKVEVPRTFLQKSKGLLFYTQIPDDFAMIFKGVRLIHTFGMKIPIDVMYLDKNNRVLFAGTIKPNRLGPYFFWKTKMIVEAKEGAFKNINKGDKIHLKGGI